jgi:hypothetical protein
MTNETGKHCAGKITRRRSKMKYIFKQLRMQTKDILFSKLDSQRTLTKKQVKIKLLRLSYNLNK